uniref:EGF-like domain-containing protein n=1 Tax=Haemonchus contortus TaxID=6289 RepID=A0A7I4YP50_HAECO|nr:Hypothetical protein CBG03167 [Haemonchus contortus]
MAVKNPPAKEDTWAFQKIGTAFPPNPVKCLGQQNMYVALWYKHGKPIHGRSWNNGGVVECSFPYKKAELRTAQQLEGNIQVLQYTGDHNTQGFWYEWIKYRERLEKAEGRQLVHCGDSFPILWKDRPEGALLGYVDNKTEIALFSFEGKVYERSGPQLNDMYIIMRNTVGGPPFCECGKCPKEPPPPPPPKPGECTCVCSCDAGKVCAPGHEGHKCSCGSGDAFSSGHESHKCTCGSVPGHQSHICSCGADALACSQGHEAHKCSCNLLGHESHKCSCNSGANAFSPDHELHKCSCGAGGHEGHKCSCGAADAFTAGHETHKCSCGFAYKPGGSGCTCKCTCGKGGKPKRPGPPPPRVMLDEWIDIRAGDPWPNRLLVKALDKTLDTIPGENPDQYVALWYQAGEPVMGRVWNENGKVAANFCWNKNEYKGNVGSIQLLVHLSEHVRGFDYKWLPYPEAATFEKDRKWIPVHVNNTKGDISSGVITIDGKQILGKVDVRNEKSSAGYGGKENMLIGPACAANTIVLCRKARPGYKFD